VIPILLLHKGALYKTIEFQNPTYVGDPINAVRIFSDKAVDELVILDVDASAEGRGPDFALIEAIASECFVPLAYGGGIASVADTRRLHRIGVEKVIVKTGAARNVGLISEIAAVGGSQSLTVSIDLIRGRFGRYRIHAPGTPLHREMDWIGYLKKIQDAGAGEVLLQSVSDDGSRSGAAIDIVRQANDVLRVPLVYAGGVGSLNDIPAIIESGANAVGAGSIFVFRGKRRAVLINYPDHELLERSLGPGT